MKKREIAAAYGYSISQFKRKCEQIPELKGNRNMRFTPKEVAIIKAVLGEPPYVVQANC